MSDLAIAVGSEALGRVEGVRRVAPDTAAPATLPLARAAADADSVELSDRAVLLSRLRELPAVRADLIQRVRADVAAGAYDTIEIPDSVIDRIVEDVELFG